MVNLVTKAVTAPFALIGNLFGGSSEELSSLAFDPGQHVVTPEREASLKSLAKALEARPGLKLDITGWADPAIDRAALGHLRVAARLRAIKRQDLASRGAAAGSAASAEVVVAPQESAALLARAYQADILDKAPPAAGSAGVHAKAPVTPAAPLPTATEMEQALFAQQQISDDDLRTLGNRRAQAAKDWLRTIGLVPEERMSLVDAKIGPAAGADDAPATATGSASASATATAPATASAVAAAASSVRVEFGLR